GRRCRCRRAGGVQKDGRKAPAINRSRIEAHQKEKCGGGIHRKSDGEKERNAEVGGEPWQSADNDADQRSGEDCQDIRRRKDSYDDVKEFQGKPLTHQTPWATKVGRSAAKRNRHGSV